MQNILRRGMPGRRAWGRREVRVYFEWKNTEAYLVGRGGGGGARDAREVQATTLFVVDKWMDAVPHDRAAAEQQQQAAAAE